MKKVSHDDLRAEYHRDDLKKGVRGKHFKASRKGSNLVLLKPDVAAAFPTETSVNNALRSLLKIAHQSAG